MTTRAIIIGGGHIGTLAGWLMPHATVLDWRKPSSDAERHRPRRHGAMYLHEPLEGLPCGSLTVRTTVDGHTATEEAVWRYKRKVGKDADMDSAGFWRRQFIEETHGYFVKEFPTIPIRWDSVVTGIDLGAHTLTLRDGQVLVWDFIYSTIPLYSLLEILGIACPRPLEYSPIAVRTGQRPIDVAPMTTDLHINYISDPAIDVYRTTDNMYGERDYEWLYNKVFTRMPGKILRPGKVYAADWTGPMVSKLNGHGIFPVGRAGRWSPDELTHDSYKDLLRWARDLRA